MRGTRRHAEIGGKRCSNCFCWKPVDRFYRKLGGYQSRCQDCNAEVVKGWAERSPLVARAIKLRASARARERYQARRELARSSR